MATRLKNIVRFVAVGAGVTVALPHLLNIDDVVAVVPDFVEPSVQGFTVTADATNVTVTNNGAVAADIDVFVEYWHSYERVFGSTLQNALAPAPFVASGLATGVSGLSYLGVATTGYNEDVYIDGINGSDSNNGLTPATALATIAALYAKFPNILLEDAQLRVHFAGTGGVNPFDQPLTPQTYVASTLSGGGLGNLIGSNAIAMALRGSQMVPFTPTTGTAGPHTVNAVTPTQRTLQNIASIDATGFRTRINLSDAAPGWTVNNFRGTNAMVRVKRGAVLVIAECPITYNGTDFLVVDLQCAAGIIVAGDTVEIVRPAVILVGTTGFFLNQEITGRMRFERIQFGASNLGLLEVVAQHVFFDRCVVVGGLLQRGGSVSCVNCKVIIFTDFGGLGFGVEIAGGGAMGNTYAFPREDSGVSPIPANLTDALVDSLVNVGGDHVAVGRSDMGHGTLLTQFTFCSYDTVYDGGVVVSNGYLTSTDAPVGLMGDGNAGVGLLCFQGGSARIRGGKNTEITGAGGALKVGDDAAIAYGVGVGAFQEVAGFNGNFHRIGGSTATVPLGDLSRIGTG